MLRGTRGVGIRVESSETPDYRVLRPIFYFFPELLLAQFLCPREQGQGQENLTDYLIYAF